MVDCTVVATPDIDAARAASVREGSLGVWLFGRGSPDQPGLGGMLPDAVAKLPGAVSTRAWDFLAIAASVFATDRFIERAGSADSWTRNLGLRVALCDPVPWREVAPKLAAALRFLTGDIWHLTFEDGGHPAPPGQARFHNYDCVSLFSGGLDSFLGALDAVNRQRFPFLVSQGSNKEVAPQIDLANALGLGAHRFDGRIRERWAAPYEPSTRARSLLFYSYGVVASDALGLDEVRVPENVLIAINPPLTARRIGSLSTRTVHPYLMQLLNEILADVGLDIRLLNPFAATPKGEMLAAADHPDISALASRSYSCGKGKRDNGQCGRCIPCLIRRAAFDRAGVTDDTRYVYDLELSSRNDDVLAARQAVVRAGMLDARALERWMMRSGPLPHEPVERAAIVDGVRRGIAELEGLFATIRWR